ncbi:hypothetical protein Godav_027943 [Gossypium davidsonii]|uniref:Aminotransferase-like plant mobile domain-containing protein n=1 Tax=Gossypium davidsonii TaxID=34287 RepID=A0A7J8RYL1_GOSDV|nr:hypothetical protein [Gossypium davidsonii]
MNGSIVTESVHAVDWRGVCGELLGLVLETIYGGCIEMSWLKRNFRGLDEDSTKVEREWHTRAYIIQIIEGILMPDKSRNLVHLRWLLKLVNFREVGELIMSIVPSAIFTSSSELLIYIPPHNKPSYVGLPNELQDIRLLLDQRSEAEFEWTPYENPTIQECILDVTIIRFQQSILVAAKDLDDVHPINLRGWMGENWPIFHVQYINMWDNRYEFLPTRNAIVALELACDSDYMPWFRIYGKPYLYGKEARCNTPSPYTCSE